MFRQCKIESNSPADARAIPKKIANPITIALRTDRINRHSLLRRRNPQQSLVSESRSRCSRIKSEKATHGFNGGTSHELEGATRRVRDWYYSRRGRIWHRARNLGRSSSPLPQRCIAVCCCRLFAGHQGARRFDRRCSASFRSDVLVRVLCPVANTFSLADASVVDGDCRAAAIRETIRQNYHNRWGCDLNRGLSLVLRVLHSGADAARVNARGQWLGAAIHFATNQPESGADSLYTRQNSCARFFRHLVFSVYCRAAGTGACSCRSSD